MIKISDKAKCCGCSACSSVCPQKCINMISDDEGFLYPQINEKLCINCNMCEKVCPIMISKNEMPHNEYIRTFAVQNKKNTVLKESTSGGFFSVIAEYVLNQNGIVFGAVYDENFEIKHVAINKAEDIALLRNSKYTQSDISDSYIKCKSELSEGKLVCFSGTPCQIAGLYSFLGKEYENLITVDVVCRGVPSPLLFKKYIEWLGGVKEIKAIRFRDKYYGYFASTMSIYFKNGKVRRREIHSDPMLNFFFNNMCSRPSCHVCSFKTKDRLSDFTMFDFWHANKIKNIFGTAGVTGLVVRNKKADNILNQILEKNFIFVEADFEQVLALDGEMMTKSIQANKNRKELFKTLIRDDFNDVLIKYGKIEKKQRIKLWIKNLLIHTGIFNICMKRKMK